MHALLVSWMAACSLAAPAGEAAKDAARPNIVYILADDLGYGDVSCYNPRSKLATPHIDRLASQGMRFTDAHSAAACTPTRYGILTGRYAWRSAKPFGVLRPYEPPLIEPGRLTVPALLKQHGYRTACVGKWHLGWDWPRPDAKSDPDFTRPIANGPTTRGFDSYFGTDVPNYPPFAFIENDRLTAQPTARFPGRDTKQFVHHDGPMVPGWRFEEIVPTHQARVKQYLQARAADKRPFFLYYTLTIPHEPIAPTAAYRNRSGIDGVGDLVLETDGMVGQVSDLLDELGLADRTMLIFASDNGHGPGTGLATLLAAGHTPSGPFRGYKGSILEGGHRVPFIVRWPGKTPAGSVCDDIIALHSLMATCAEVLGVKLPAGAGEDSFSILPLLLGKKPDRPTHPTLCVAGGLAGYCTRRGPWKYIEGVTPDEARARPTSNAYLFNLADDPAETKNLIEQHPQIAQELKAVMEATRAQGRAE